MNYGKITVGVGTEKERELSIVNFVQCKSDCGRIIDVCEIEDGSVAITVSSNFSSQTIWLSIESFALMMSASNLFSHCKELLPLIAVMNNNSNFSSSMTINFDTI